MSLPGSETLMAEGSTETPSTKSTTALSIAFVPSSNRRFEDSGDEYFDAHGTSHFDTEIEASPVPRYHLICTSRACSTNAATDAVQASLLELKLTG